MVDRRGRPLGEREEGRIEFCGPSVTAGYWRNPTATRAARRDGWMDSGDLGYWADGELFITGRVKDLIKKAGRNLYPQEVEDIVGAIPGIRKGCVAAFGVHDPSVGTERLVVVAETRRPRSPRAGAPAGGGDGRAWWPRWACRRMSWSSPTRTPSSRRPAARCGAAPRAPPTCRASWVGRAARSPCNGRGCVLGAVAARVRGAAGRLPALVGGAYLASLLLLTIPPLWLLVRLAPTGPAADRAVRLWCRLILALSGCSLRLEGGESPHRRGGPGRAGREPRQLSRRRRPPRGVAASRSGSSPSTSWPGRPWWAA